MLDKLEKTVDLVKNNNFAYTLEKGRIIFHARIKDKHKEMFTIDEMWRAPSERTSQNRYNEVGFPEYYCANNPYVLAMECRLDSSINQLNYLSLLVQRDIILFPVDRIFGHTRLFDISVAEEKDSHTYKIEYALSCILSAIVCEKGLDGLVYISTKDRVSTNYTIFNISDRDNDLLTGLHVYRL